MSHIPQVSSSSNRIVVGYMPNIGASSSSSSAVHRPRQDASSSESKVQSTALPHLLPVPMPYFLPPPFYPPYGLPQMPPFYPMGMYSPAPPIFYNPPPAAPPAPMANTPLSFEDFQRYISHIQSRLPVQPPNVAPLHHLPLPPPSVASQSNVIPPPSSTASRPASPLVASPLNHLPLPSASSSAVRVAARTLSPLVAIDQSDEPLSQLIDLPPIRSSVQEQPHEIALRLSQLSPSIDMDPFAPLDGNLSNEEDDSHPLRNPQSDPFDLSRSINNAPQEVDDEKTVSDRSESPVATPAPTTAKKRKASASASKSTPVIKRNKKETRLPYSTLENMFHENMGFLGITFANGKPTISNKYKDLKFDVLLTEIQAIFDKKRECCSRAPANLLKIRSLRKDMIRNRKITNPEEKIVASLFDSFIELALFEMDKDTYSKVKSTGLDRNFTITSAILQSYQEVLKNNLNQFMDVILHITNDLIERMENISVKPQNRRKYNLCRRVLKRISESSNELDDLIQANPIPKINNRRKKQISESSNEPGDLTQANSIPKINKKHEISLPYSKLESIFHTQMGFLDITFENDKPVIPNKHKNLNLEEILTELQGVFSRKKTANSQAPLNARPLRNLQQKREASLNLLTPEESVASKLFDLFFSETLSLIRRESVKEKYTGLHKYITKVTDVRSLYNLISENNLFNYCKLISYLASDILLKIEMIEPKPKDRNRKKGCVIFLKRLLKESKERERLHPSASSSSAPQAVPSPIPAPFPILPLSDLSQAASSSSSSAAPAPRASPNPILMQAYQRPLALSQPGASSSSSGPPTMDLDFDLGLDLPEGPTGTEEEEWLTFLAD